MEHPRRLIDLSKAYLREYFSDGIARQPSDLEDEIVGGVNMTALMMGDAQWKRSPFMPALGELIAEGYVRYWREEDGWHYQLSPKGVS